MKNNKESYTSTTPSSMSWIENDMTKLTKVNTQEIFSFTITVLIEDNL